MSTVKQPDDMVTTEPVTRASDSLIKSFWSRVLGYFRSTPRIPSPPRLGRVVLHMFRCVGCAKPLEDGQLVVTVDGELSTGESFPFTGHAACMVLVRKPDGAIDGTPHKHSVLLNESEWERWKATGETPEGAVRVYGVNEHALGRMVSRG